MSASQIEGETDQRQRSYLAKYFVAALLLGLFAAVFYRDRIEKFHRDLDRTAQLTLERASEALRNELETGFSDILLLATDRTGCNAAAEKGVFKSLLRERPAYIDVGCVDLKQGDLVRIARKQTTVTKLPIVEGHAALDQLPYRLVGGLGPGAIFIYRPTESAAPGQRGTAASVFGFAMPVFDAQLNRIGVVHVTYDARALLGTLGDLAREAGGNFTLLDGAGRHVGGATRAATRADVYRHWTAHVAVSGPTSSDHSHRLQVEYFVAQADVTAAKHRELLLVVLLWLLAALPVMYLLWIAQRASHGELRARRALDASEERLLDAERMARIGHWRWDPQGSHVTLSPQAAAMLGREPGEQHLLLTEATGLHVLADERSFIEHVNEVIATGESWFSDVCVPTLRGNRWLHAIIRATRDSSGAVDGAFGTFQDITARKKMEEELRALKAEYAALLDHIPAVVCYVDQSAHVCMVNRALTDMVDIPREHIEGKHIAALDPVDGEDRAVQFSEVMRTDEPQRGVLEVVRLRDGSKRWLEVDRIPRRDAQGRIVGVVVYGVDVTQRRLAEEQLRAVTAEREMLLNRIPAIVIYKDLSARIVRANRMAAALAGKPIESIEGRPFAEVFPSLDHERVKHIDREVMLTREPKLGWVESFVMPDGGTRWFQVDLFPNVDTAGEVIGLVLFSLDVTERKLADQQATYLATHDPLTDLCNRRFLGEQLAQTVQRCNRHDRHAALLFIDLDRFKYVNDTHGHDVGDALLVQVARRLRECVRADDVVARTGGDEFVVLLNEIAALADALAVADKIRRVLSQVVEIRGLPLSIGCSVGIATYPEHGSTEHELMCAADQAMYAAKTAGRNNIQLAASVAPQPLEGEVA